MGAYLIDQLRGLKAKSIGEVRGRGLLVGLEMTADDSRTPMPEAQVVRIQKVVREAGVVRGPGRTGPPSG